MNEYARATDFELDLYRSLLPTFWDNSSSVYRRVRIIIWFILGGFIWENTHGGVAFWSSLEHILSTNPTEENIDYILAHLENLARDCGFEEDGEA